MKCIIAGTRTVNSRRILEAAIEASGMADQITEVVSGCAPGVDTLAIQWAEERGLRVTKFPADWNRYGKSAGPRRNREMADYADALIALWQNESRGTKNMIDEADMRGLKVFVHQVPSN